MKNFTSLVFITLLLAAAVQSAPSSKLGDTLEQKLAQPINNVGVDILISMEGGIRRVLNNLASVKFNSRNERLNLVASSLKAHASESQEPVLSFLKSQSASFVSFWINNQILVKGANAELIHELGQFEQISVINLDERIPLEKYEPAVPADDNTILAEWNVEDIKAQLVWELGSNGTGARVAIVATGARSTHEALASNYMGNYGWFDPYTGSSTPIDQDGLGTYTVGIVAGTGGIGVAPGATWQACLGCQTVGCTQSALVACGQWAACPTMFDGNAPDCTKAPHAVVNGWGAGGGSDFYDDVIRVLRIAGVIPIFGVGATGGVCGGVGSPGDSRAGVLAVGSYTQTYAITSARGPNIHGDLKPDLVGPGSNIRSAYHTTDNSYTTLSSTGNGPAHILGAIALLAGLKNDLTHNEVYSLLAGTAEPVNSEGQSCGDIPDTSYPNNAAGYGRINAFRAAVALNARHQ